MKIMQIKKILALVMILSFFGIHSANAVQLLRDEEIERILKAISAPIFKQANISADSVNFILVEDSQLNAFVAGGKNIFINTGLILETDNIEELVGVIAHETGHIASGHLVRLTEATEGLSAKAILSSILGMAVAVGTGSAEAGVLVSTFGSDAAMKDILKHTRTQEGTADQSAIKFLKGAGLPISGLVSFMKKLESQELLPESQQSEYLRTHPLTQDRVESLQYASDNNPKGVVPEKWVEYHQRMKAKTLGYISPDEALTIKGDGFADKYGKAIAYFRKGDFEKSVPLTDELLKVEPKNPYLHELKGQIMFDRGNIEGSIASYKVAASILPSSSLIGVGYCQSLLEAVNDKKARELEAIKTLNLIVRMESNRSSEPYHLLGIAYGRQGNEGMSSLSLAEEALMENNMEFARMSALRAKAKLPAGTPASLRADDILASINMGNKDKDGAKGKGKDKKGGEGQ